MPERLVFPPLQSMTQPQVVSAIRELSGGRYEALGTLAEDEGGTLVCLARQATSRTLVVVRLDPVGLRADGSREYALAIVPELDDSIPAASRSCISCQSRITDWRRFCAVCGADQSEPAGGAESGMSPSQILLAVREAAGAEYEVLGHMPRAGGGAPVYFAREIASGKVVTMSLRREATATGAESYSVGVTTLIQAGPRKIPSSSTPTPQPAHRGEPEAPGGGPPPPPSDRGVTPPPDDGRRVCPTCREEFGAEVRFCPSDGSVLARAGGADQGLVGRVIADRYRILSRIGEGGFGQVYMAEHSKMRRRCAIKVMNPSLRHDAEALERFTREAANSSQINHPNVATIYDFGETSDGLIYLAMELVEGETLADMLIRERPLPVVRAVEIARQICEALIAAHNLGIVHRDLKPYNIILATTYDGSDLVKVVDFGIAKAVQGASQGLTRAGYVIGTPEYMSPEQLVGDPVDGRSDVYSVGCILFEMVTGEQTFSGPSLQVLNRRLTEDPPRVRDLVPDASQVLDDIVSRALARDPATRFQSAEGLRDALAGATRSISGERVITFRRGTDEREAAVAASMTPGSTPAPPPNSGTGSPHDIGIPALDGAAGASGSGGDPATPSRNRVLMAASVAGVLVVGSLAYALLGGSAPDLSSSAINLPASGLLPGDVTDDVGDSPATPAAGVETTTAELRIEGALPAGSVIQVDGRSVAGPLLSLDSGIRRVRVSADGYSPLDSTFSIAGGERLSWSPVLRRAESAPAPVAAATPAATPGALPAAPPPSPPAPSPAAADPRATDVIGAAAGQPAPAVREPEPEARPPQPSALEVATPQINAALDRFAAALASRNLDQLRSAYPGMSSNEQATWGGFFDGVRDLSVEITARQTPQLSGDLAHVSFTMRLVYADRRGSQQTVQAYRATLLAGGGGWRLDAVRAE